MKRDRTGLDNRLRTMYKNGSVGFLDVLLGSNSISEFISNLEMIQRIYKNDQNTLTTLEEQHQELEEKQTALKGEFFCGKIRHFSTISTRFSTRFAKKRKRSVEKRFFTGKLCGKRG